jgi:ADP-heptose:LPS heptosyltransferase
MPFICRKVSFRETIALVDLCEFCVTGDTALMHAASALGKRVYALFGPTNPVETVRTETGISFFRDMQQPALFLLQLHC